MIAASVMSSARTGTGRDDWRTPQVVLERVRKIGPIALDPCTAEDNPAKAFRWRSGGGGENDGLVANWRQLIKLGTDGLSYVNPPYSQAKAWAAKMAAEGVLGCPIIALVAARPDTSWWRTLLSVADVVGFWRGRITFVGAKHPAPFPSAIVGINVSPRRFRAAFGDKCDVMGVS